MAGTSKCFRSPWSLLAESTLHFDKGLTNDCFFSRAWLSDKDLMTTCKGKRWEAQSRNTVFAALVDMHPEHIEKMVLEGVDSLQDDDFSEDYAEEKSGDFSKACGNKVDEDFYEIEDLSEELALLGLPLHFGKERKARHRKNEKVQKRNVQPADESFISYWKRVGDYVVRRSWLDYYGQYIKNEADRVEWEKITNGMKPSGLLEEHEHIKMSLYGFVTGMSSLLYYEKETKERGITNGENDNRMREDNKKNCKLGFVEMYEDVDFQVNEDESKRVARLYPSNVVYPSESTEEKADDDAIQKKNFAEELYRESINIADFDFGYDEDRDARLLAKNAQETFADDKGFKKYWHQRYRLFSKLDHGILMDYDGWFSVTPERIAEHVADRVVLEDGSLVLDGFAGVGGNSIQLALKGAYVVALDIDPIRLRCAARNAQIYGVADRITFILTDFFHFTKSVASRRRSCSFSAVLLCPPWGGPSYIHREAISLNDLTPNGVEVFDAALKCSYNIAYYLPRQTLTNELVALSNKSDGRCEVEQSMLNYKVKAITAYYGDLVWSK